MGAQQQFNKPAWTNPIDDDLDAIRDNYYFLAMTAAFGSMILPGWNTEVIGGGATLKDYGNPSVIKLVRQRGEKGATSKQIIYFNLTWVDDSVTAVQMCYDDGVSSPGLSCFPVIEFAYDDEGNFTGPPVSSLLTGMISWWDLQEASGNRADSHGSNTLIDTNTVGSRTGQGGVGTAADYNHAAAEHFTVASGHGMDFSTLSQISVAGWFIFDVSFIPHYMVHAGTDYNITTDFAYNLRRNTTTTTIEWRIGAATGVRTTIVDAAVSNGTWAFVYAYANWDTEEAGLSINDGTVATASLSGKTKNSTAYTFYQGFAQPSYDLNGGANSLAIFNRALTTDEVTTLYNSGTRLNYADL